MSGEEELHYAFSKDDVRAFGESRVATAAAVAAAAALSALSAPQPAVPTEGTPSPRLGVQEASEETPAERERRRVALTATMTESRRRRSWIESVEHFPVPQEQRRTILWTFHAAYLSNVRHAEYTLAITRSQLTNLTAFRALAYCLRDRLIERWKDTETYVRQMDVKTVNYLSLEYLMGRSLQNAAECLGLQKKYAKALRALGVVMEELGQEESDAGLGNGGLGRLAACYMDSMAALDMPAWGYGLRYTYGMFSQAFNADGEQVEAPDYWLNFQSAWEIERLDVTYPVRFGGHVRDVGVRAPGQPPRVAWEGGYFVVAVAYDVPVPGYDTPTALNVRLWSAKPSSEFDFESFSRGDYYRAVENKQMSENITNVLYPNDSTSCGKELRLQQQYFFVAATLRDILVRHKQLGRRVADLPRYVAVQLNDTHPALCVPELMRLLVDEEGMQWGDAWQAARHVFSYTNHTVLPEALETWPAEMLQRLLPRHWRIIVEINHLFLRYVDQTYPGDDATRRAVSIVEEGTQRVRMAHLAIVGSHTVNGVAALHTDLLQSIVFPRFHALWPAKFRNVTNGVTPRRWLHQANPFLSVLITEALGGATAWVSNLALLRGLLPFADDDAFLARWHVAKMRCKERLASFIEQHHGLEVDPSALFDIQAKRFHEYKRQLLHCLALIDRWIELRLMSPERRALQVRRVHIIAGKAAPGYIMAKHVIHLFNRVAARINSTPETRDLLRVAVLPNYGVSMAELLVPASDISEHISTAGFEASGTSNMKFALNGGLLLGTYDGANIEIVREIGEKNAFIFGARAHEVAAARTAALHEPQSPRFLRAMDEIRAGTFGPALVFEPILTALRPENDYFILGHDFPSYIAEIDKVDAAFKDSKQWCRMSLESTALMGFFSSDRSVEQYASDIWHVKVLLLSPL